MFFLVIFFIQILQYQVEMDNAKQHEIKITLTFESSSKAVYHFRMSRTSPGRYALHEFAKNVSQVVLKADTKEYRLERPNLHEWVSPMISGKISLSYILYANRADGTYASVSENYLHLNIPATFIYVKEFVENEIEIKLKIPKDWSIASQLVHKNQHTLSAKNHYYFMDSPILAGKLDLKSFGIKENQKDYQFELALKHHDTEIYSQVLKQLTESVVYEMKEVFGELPNFDYNRYTFLSHYSPDAEGDGMEHRNSTMLSSSSSLKQNMMGLLNTVSHEFFHSWNVERLRPKSLEPFNFEEATLSEALWLAEGFTSYYDKLIIHRAGLSDLEDYLNSIEFSLNVVMNWPGRHVYSPVEMSMQAPFVDAAASIDPHNRMNTYISYYTYGSMIALGLDLSLRNRFNTDLDHVMRYFYQQHGKTEIPYHLSDFEAAIAHFSSKDFAVQFMNDHINGKKTIDFVSLLEKFGFVLKQDDINNAWLGPISFKDSDKGVYLNSQISKLSPFYQSSIKEGDILLKLNEIDIQNVKQLQDLIKQFKVNQQVAIRFKHIEDIKTETIVLNGNPQFNISTFEKNKLPLNDSVKQLRLSWLGKKSSYKNVNLKKYCHQCLREYEIIQKYCSYDGKKLEFVKK